MLANRNTLIRYCVENVYQALTLDAKRVLHCLQLARTGLSVGDLKVLQSDMTADDLNSHISSLSRVGLVSTVTKEYRTLFVVDETAREFLVLSGLVDNEDSKALTRQMKDLRKKISFRSPIDSFSPWTIDGDDVEPLVWTVLTKILQPKWKQTESKEFLVNKALEMIDSAPKFWESYRVLGEIYSQLGEIERSIEYHERALAVCPVDRELSRSRLHYFLALKLHEVDDERAMAEFCKAVELYECFNTLINYARSLIYVGQYPLAVSTLDRAMEFAENSTDFYLVDKFKFDCLRRKCEGLLGEEQLLGAMATLNFCLESVALRWDCPRDKRFAIVDGVSDALAYLCQGCLSSINSMIDNREEVVEILLRIDSMMTNWEIVDWPKLLEGSSRKGLRNLSKVVASEPKLVQRLGEKVNNSLDSYGFSSLATISGTLKVWRADAGFGFVTLKYGELHIEAYFHRRELRRSEDEAKMAFRETHSISGELHKDPNDERYYLSSVEVD